jgi:hypothetical protein
MGSDESGATSYQYSHCSQYTPGSNVNPKIHENRLIWSLYAYMLLERAEGIRLAPSKALAGIHS